MAASFATLHLLTEFMILQPKAVTAQMDITKEELMSVHSVITHALPAVLLLQTAPYVIQLILGPSLGILAPVIQAMLTCFTVVFVRYVTIVVGLVQSTQQIQCAPVARQGAYELCFRIQESARVPLVTTITDTPLFANPAMLTALTVLINMLYLVKAAILH